MLTSAEEAAAAAEELNAQSLELRRIVDNLGSLVGNAKKGSSSASRVARSANGAGVRMPRQTVSKVRHPQAAVAFTDSREESVTRS